VRARQASREGRLLKHHRFEDGELRRGRPRI
jgi:hypothetical protein